MSYLHFPLSLSDFRVKKEKTFTFIRIIFIRDIIVGCEVVTVVEVRCRELYKLKHVLSGISQRADFRSNRGLF